MSQPLPLPVAATTGATWRYTLHTTGWHRLAYGLFGLLAAASVMGASYLLGMWTGQYIAVEQAEQALPAADWPEQSSAVAAGFNSDDGDPLTLTVRELRYRLEVIDTNAGKVASGAEPAELNGERPDSVALESADADEAVAEYWDWVDSHGCLLGGWSGESRAQVAVLVRNGVWDCSGFARWLATLPTVIGLGPLFGLLAIPLLLAGLYPLLLHGWRRVRRVRKLYRMHRRLYGSWMG